LRNTGPSRNFRSFGAPDSITGTTYETQIGAHVYAAGDTESRNPSNFFDGYIDEVQVYGRALGAEEIEYLYNGSEDQGRVDALEISPGDYWKASVFGCDAYGCHEQPSNVLDFVNDPPNQPSNITLTTASDAPHLPNEDLDGNIGTPAVDPEGDDITYVYNWYRTPSGGGEALNATTMFGSDLVGYWPLDHDVLDYAGTYDMTESGTGALNSSGQVEGAYDFPNAANDSYLSSPDAADLTFGDGSTDEPFSIFFWYYVENVAVSQTFVAKNQHWNGAGSHEVEYFTWQDASGNLTIALYDQSTYNGSNATNYILASAGGVLEDDAWQSVAFTYDGSGNVSGLQIYHNGEALSETTDASGGYIAMEDTDAPLYMGGYQNGSGDTDYQSEMLGALDEVQMYNKALSATEIEQLHYGGLNGGDDLSSDRTVLDDAWEMGVQACDAEGGCSAEVRSNSISITNNAPNQPQSIALDSNPAGEPHLASDDLDGSFVPATTLDDDGDDVSYIYNWYKASTREGDYSTLQATNVLQTSGQLSDDLIAYFPFDHDKLDYAGNVTLGAGASVDSSGLVDGALNFDANDHVVSDYTGDLQGLSFWYKYQGDTSCDIGWNCEHAALVAQSTTSASTGFYFARSGSSSYHLLRVGGASYSIEEATVTTTDWTHVVITHDTSNTYVYVNGTLVETIGAVWTTAGELNFGKKINESRYFNGLLDEVQVYNRLIDESGADEITKLYQGGRLGGEDLHSDMTSVGEYWKNEVIPCDIHECGTAQTLLNANALLINTPPDDPTDLRVQGIVGGKIEDTTPTFLFDLTDADTPQVVKYQLQVDTVNTFDNDPYERIDTTGAPADRDDVSHTLAAEDALAVGTYYWRVKAIDVVDAESDWVSGGSFQVEMQEVPSGVTNLDLDSNPAGAPHLPSDSLDGSFTDATDSNSDDISYVYNWYKAAEREGDYSTLQATNVLNTVNAGALSWDANLVGYWPLDANVQDYAGDNDGTISGATPTSGGGGQIDEAYSFDGVDDYLEVAGFPFNSTYTLSAWIRPEEAGDDVYRAIVSKGGVFDGDTNYTLGVRERVVSSEDNITLYYHNGGSMYGTEVAVTGNVFDDWHHVVATFDASINELKIYYDSVLLHTESFAAEATDGGQSLRIGAPATDDSSDDYFLGKIDEIQIYDDVLTAVEVSQIYQGSRLAGEDLHADSTLAGEYWKNEVIPCDQYGCGTAETLENANAVLINTDPDAPVIDNFNDGSTTFDATPTLQFDLSDSDTGQTVKYQLQVDNNSDFSSPEVDVTEGSGQTTDREDVTYTTATLAEDDYYWRVKAIDEYDAESDWTVANSGAVAFVVNIQDLPNAPSVTLTTPSDAPHGPDENLNGTVDPAETEDADGDAVSYLYNWYESNDEGSSYDLYASNILYEVNGDMDDNLIGYWPLDSDAKDYAGGNDGSTSEAVVTTSDGGKIDEAYEFDGNNQEIVISDADALDFTGNFSIATWLYMDDTTSDPCIVCKGDAAADTGYVFFMWNEKLTMSFGDGGGGWPYSGNLQGDTSLEAGNWYHVAVTRSGTNATFYLNGQPDGVRSVGGNAIAVNGLDLWFGNDVDAPTGGQDLDGKLDEMQLYDRAISANEVAQIYNATALGVTESAGDLNIDLGSSHTELDDCWKLGAQACDADGCADEILSNQICLGNTAPNTPAGIDLDSATPDVSHLPTENLDGSFTVATTLDVEGDAVSYVYNWYKDSTREGSYTEIQATNVLNDGTDLDTRLVGYWPLDSDAKDYAGDNDGNLVGSPVQETGSVGGAYNFDENGKHVVVPDVDDLDLLGDFAISMWVKIGNSVDDNSTTLISKHDVSGDTGWVYFVQENTNDATVYFAYGDGAGGDAWPGGSTASASTVIPFGSTWQHIAVVFDTTADTLQFYLNGEPDGTTSSVTDGMVANTRDFWMGGNVDTPEGDVDGINSMDEVQIYNEVLSAAEISKIYQGSRLAGEDLHADVTAAGEYWKNEVMPCDQYGCGTAVTLANADALLINTRPTAPVLDSTINGENVSANPPTLQFDLVDLDTPQNIKYQIQIDDNEFFPSPETDVIEGEEGVFVTQEPARDDITYTLTSALEDNIYYWRVRTIDALQAVEDTAQSYSEWSDSSFVVPNEAPTVHFDNYKDGSTTTNNQPTLQFDIADPNPGDIVSYEIELASDALFENTIQADDTDVGSATPRNDLTLTPSVELEDGTYYWRVIATDDLGLTSEWQSAIEGEGVTASFVVDATAPEIVNIEVTPVLDENGAITSTTITWDTNIEATTIIEYGLTTAYGHEMTEKQLDGVTNGHADAFTHTLIACTQYHFRVKSRYGDDQFVASADQVFTTPGCIGNAAVVVQNDPPIIDKTVGRTEQLSASGVQVNTVVPAGFSDINDAQFQIKKIDKVAALVVTGSPTGKTLLDDHFYDIKGMVEVDEENTDYDQAITITLGYDEEDLGNVEESTLRIYHWDVDESEWDLLPNCSNDTAGNTVSCESTEFSPFGVFGDEVEVVEVAAPVESAGTSGKHKTLHYAGMQRDEMQTTSSEGVSLAEFEQAYAESQNQVLTMNEYLPGGITKATDRYGNEIFLGYVPGRVGRSRMVSLHYDNKLIARGSRDNRDRTRQLLVQRSQKDSDMKASAPVSLQQRFDDLAVNVKKQRTMRNVAAQKTGLKRPRGGDGLDIRGHLAQRERRKYRTSRFPQQRYMSEVRPSRIKLKTIHKVKKPTEIKRIYRGLRNSLFNVSAILQNSMFDMQGIMQDSAANLFYRE